MAMVSSTMMVAVMLKTVDRFKILFRSRIYGCYLINCIHVCVGWREQADSQVSG